MALPSNFISQVAYFDLQTLSYTKFMHELVFAHALLQRTASGNGDSNELTLFYDMRWWYSVLTTPATSSHNPRQWSILGDEEGYGNMLHYLTSYLGPAEFTIELTNNLSFVNANFDLPVSSYPIVELALETGSTTTIPVYPCLLRLSKTAILSRPFVGCNTYLHPQHPPPDTRFKENVAPESNKPPIQLRLYLRPSSRIHRRYSNAFDRYTEGLNGSSPAKVSRSRLHSSRFWKSRTYLDLAGFTGDTFAAENGGAGMPALPFVDVQRVLEGRDGTNTSVLWSEEVYAFICG